MLHLPRPSASHVARPRAPSTAGSNHSSDRSPSPTASSAPPPTLSSPASSFAPLAGVGAGPARLPPGRQGGWRPYTERQPILVRGPKRNTKRIDEMTLDVRCRESPTSKRDSRAADHCDGRRTCSSFLNSQELNENLNRNARVLSDRSIFPPRRPSSPPDPHHQKLVAMQAQLEERMSLLSTQDGVASLSVDGIASGPNGDFGLGQSPEQGTGSYRRLSTQTSPVLYVTFCAASSRRAFVLTSADPSVGYSAETRPRARLAEPTRLVWMRRSPFSRRCLSENARASRLGRRL